ncbi:NADPH:quinone reductase [bacterium]|nr:NADPH:quinone reductase [bacterium]
MKAAYIEAPGPATEILYGDLEVPVPQKSEVLIKVDAVSVNPIDTYLRSGNVPMELPMPYVIGCDVAGTVEVVGPEVSRFRPGERVWGSNQGLLGRQGTTAEFVCVDETWLYPTPNNVTDASAAAMSLVGITAHLGLVHRGQLQAGETVFVNGGSGGVGSAVVQMAKCLGAAKVITTAGSEEKAETCRQLGADHVILYRQEDVLSEVQSQAPDGVDLWWETVREPQLDRAVTALARNGRIIVMAGRDARSEVPIGPFYAKGCSLLGFVMFMTPAEVQRRAAEEIYRWLAEGRLVPRIDRELSFSEAAQAHAIQEGSTVGCDGSLQGKIVLVP